MKRLLTLILLCVGVLAFIVWSYQRKEVIGKKYLKINNVEVIVELARSDAERAKGLGYRDSLPENTGMLFVFNDPKRWDFWMEGMRFGLDFLWIENERVVDITESVPPPSETGNVPVFVRPRAEVHYVLEVNKGWIQRHGLAIGDRVEFHI